MRWIRSVALVAVAVAVTLGVTSGGHLSGGRAGDAGRPPVPPGNAATARLIAQHEVANPELRYVPLLTPCRVGNTLVKGGPLASGRARVFQISGSSGVATTGGPAAGCGIPLTAKAVALSVTGARTTASGDLVAFANGSPKPITRTLSLLAGNNATASAQVALGSGAYRGSIIVVNRTAGATDLVLDATGYFIPQIHGLIYPGNIYSGSARILSAAKVSTGVYDVTVDGDITDCTATTTAYYDRYYYSDARTQSAHVMRIYSWYLDSNSHLPVAVDNYVWLTVTC